MFQNPQPSRHVSEPYIGYRSWTVRAEDGALGSQNSFVVWPVGGIQAVCRTHVQVPHPNCHCGIYAASSNEWLASQMAYHMYWRDDGYTINGVCELWGRVIPYDEGWRAEYAQPIVIYYTDTSYEIALKVSRRYNAPLEPRPLIHIPKPPKVDTTALTQRERERRREYSRKRYAEQKALMAAVRKKAKELGLDA